MNSVTVSREIDASPERLREEILDVAPFMESSEFGDVEVRDGRIHITNVVGLFLEIELDLEIVERDDAVLSYEQRSGIFNEMWTTYRVEETDDGSRVTAQTEFELDVDVIGPLLDKSVVKRQRTLELKKQLNYLESITS